MVYQDSATDSRLLGDLVPQVRARHISSFEKTLSLLVGAPIEACTFVTYNLSSMVSYVPCTLAKSYQRLRFFILSGLVKNNFVPDWKYSRVFFQSRCPSESCF